MHIHAHSQVHNLGGKSFPILVRKALIVFLMECLSKCPSYKNPFSRSEKLLVVLLHSGIILFAKWFILNVWQCSEYLCLSNCSVNSVTLCYVLHQKTHSEKFWHIQHPVSSGIRQHIKSYSALLKHIHSYWDIVKGYPGIFSTLCNPSLFTILSYSEPWHI